MSKHTPGPWRAAKNLVFAQLPDMKIYLINEAEDEANARLIAACPELLEEHKAWARDFGMALLLFLQGDHSAIDNLARDMIIDRDNDGPVLRSTAIAKAEGGIAR